MNSKKASVGASIDAQFNAALSRLTPCVSSPCSLLIALSGGVDSVVLLSLAAKWRNSHQGAAQEGSVRAIYVDHGLQSQSAQWGQQCAAICEAFAVDFTAVKVQVDCHSGLSPEAAARNARYDVFKQHITAGEFLCTAHHADDQAETLLLQLFRGAGVHGLASMPECRAFESGFIVRPLLNISRGEIVSYATKHDLDWCEDPSNADTRYDRNFVRHEVMPSLTQRWPQLVQSISRSAAHCAEASDIANDLAVSDIAALHLTAATSTLPVADMKLLQKVRRKNLIRYWVMQHGFLPPSQVQLEQILLDVLGADDSTHGTVSFGTAAISRYRDQIYLAPREAFAPIPDYCYPWPDSRVPLYIPEIDWHINANDHGRLRTDISRSLHVSNRRGGERWKAPDAAHSQSVKTLLQERRVPPWQRKRLVLVYCGDQLVDICGPEFKL